MFLNPRFQYHCNWRVHCENAMVTIEKIWEQLKDMKTALDKTVILWGKDDVLTRAVEMLLTAKGEWRLVRITEDLDDLSLAQIVEEVTPDVLIVHEEVLNNNARLVVKFVRDYSKLKIITIGLDNNQMEIYSKKRVCIKEASDLLAAIKNGSAAEM